MSAVLAMLHLPTPTKVDGNRVGEYPDSPSGAIRANGENEFPDPSNPGQESSSDIEASENGEVSIAENPFDSKASRVLFDAIDHFQSCGAGEYIDIPQLVIVGGQSTGKSSLLQSLTDIPFPVGADCCTRFATRIVSRRTAPGTVNQVKVTIVPPDFRTEHFDYAPNESYREYVQVKESLTAEEFSDIMKEVTTMYMGINPGRGINKKNFAVEVLKVEISGPTRSHFSILDIPGIFSNDFNVNEGEMLGVRNMVIEYMKQPESIVICVADAGTDLAMQEIFKLADQYVDKTRLVGVFTKCDLLKRAVSTIAIANGRVEGLGQLLHHGWFVVRNRADGDDEDPYFDLQNAERDLFSKSPWTEIRETRRGSAMLKKYLGKLLCDKIKVAFPRLLAKVKGLLNDAQASKERLGEPRTTHQLRQVYLADIAQKYEAIAREALERPWQLDCVTARARNLIRDENEAFGARMRVLGHVYEFEDHALKEDECIQRMREIIVRNEDRAQQNALAAAQANGNPTPDVTPRRKRRASRVSNPAPKRDHSVRSSEALFAKIRHEVNICNSTELPGLVHPDVIRRLYKVQTEKWHIIAEDHLKTVALGVTGAAEEILNIVCPPGGSTSVLHDELLLIIRQFYDEALRRSLGILETYCKGDRIKLLQTTDPGFVHKLRLLQSLRMMKNIDVARQLVDTEENNHSVEELSILLFNACHHTALDNTVNEVHDALKVYYEFSSQSFIRHITNTVVEDFVTDPDGPLKGLSATYVYSLPDDEVERLGRESRDVVEERLRLDSRIKTLKAAEATARMAMVKTSNLD